MAMGSVDAEALRHADADAEEMQNAAEVPIPGGKSRDSTVILPCNLVMGGQAIYFDRRNCGVVLHCCPNCRLWSTCRRS